MFLIEIKEMPAKTLKEIMDVIRQHELFDLIGDGISIQDTNFRILYQNIMHKKMLGDHTGKYCHEAYKQESKVCEGCPLAITFQDGGVYVNERRVIIDNEERYFKITSSPLRNSKGVILAGVEVVREITDRHAKDTELKERSEELEKFYEMAIGRELRMKELKEEIKNLKSALLTYKNAPEE